MKLARKLAAGLILGIFIVMAVNGWVRISRDVAFFEADRNEQERVLGRVLRASVEAVAQSDGEAAAQDLVRHADDSVSEFRLRWVWLDDEDPSFRPTIPATSLSGLQSGRRIVRARYSEDGDERRFVYLPIALQSGRAAALEISESLQRQHHYMRASILQTAAATLVIATICGVLATLLGVAFVGRPIRALCEQARRVGAGDLSGRPTVQQRDEIGELARELNAMCDRLSEAQQRVAAEVDARIATLEQLRHADRLKTVGQLASGVAHELGTPLNVILGRAKRLRASSPSPEEVRRTTDVIAEMSERMITIIRQLLDFARRRGPRLGRRDVAEIARRSAEMLSPIAEKRGVITYVEARGPVFANVDENQIQQALTNLMLNGIQAMEPGGHLMVKVAVEAMAPIEDGLVSDHVRITVEDQGYGIVPDAVPHIFEPFFTTKGVGEGTGLGLSVAYGIIREHGGWITVNTMLGSGTRFAVYLRCGDDGARMDCA